MIFTCLVRPPVYIIRTVSMRHPVTVEKLATVQRRGQFPPEQQPDREPDREGYLIDTPAFEECDSPDGCACPGCALGRRLPPCSTASGAGGRTPARGAVVLVAAAGAALGAGHCGPAAVALHASAEPDVPPGAAGDEPDAPQGEKGPLHGAAGRPTPDGVPGPTFAAPATTRADIIRRARAWVAGRVPYSMTAFWPDGYRQDCSGYVSMAWNLGQNEWTGSLAAYGDPISRDELQPGDILLFHNPKNPQDGSHVVLFGGWTDYTHTYYLAYEQTRPYTRRQPTPYPYWSDAGRYAAYRYKGLVAGSAGATASPAGAGGAPEPGGAGAAHFPGASAFGNGAHNGQVTRLGRMLAERGGARFYTTGPGPRWTDADRRATRAFQRAQGWEGDDADGLPGPMTWAYLVGDLGRDIPPPERSERYPGRGMFRPGAANRHVDRLGRRLVERGFGAYYSAGPSPRWSEADRRNVEAFQRAQGWRGAAADGYPGPETWRRLFS